MAQTDGQTITLDGIVYTVLFLKPPAAMKLANRIGKVLGPALGTLGEAALANDDTGKLSKAAEQFFGALNDETIDIAIAQMASVTLADGVKLEGQLDVHFLGHNERMMQWLYFALKMNVGPFFSVAQNVFGLALPKPLASPSPST